MNTCRKLVTLKSIQDKKRKKKKNIFLTYLLKISPNPTIDRRRRKLRIYIKKKNFKKAT